MPRPRDSSKSEDGKSTKDRILEIAIDLFSRNGFNGVSIRDIAREVGIKESSIYNHYRSKDEILTAVFDLYQSALDKITPTEKAVIDAIQMHSPDEFWKGGLERFMAQTQNPTMDKISKIVITEMFRDERARDIAFKEYFTRQQDLVERIFRRMMELGQIRQVDPKALANAYSYPLLSMQIEYNLLKNWGLDTDPVKNKMERHIDFLVGAVKTGN